MTPQLAKSLISLFGLYLVFMACISIAKYGIGLMESGAFSDGMPSDLVYDLFRLGVPLIAGSIALKRSSDLARLVSSPVETGRA